VLVGIAEGSGACPVTQVAAGVLRTRWPAWQPKVGVCPKGIQLNRVTTLADDAAAGPRRACWHTLDESTTAPAAFVLTAAPPRKTTSAGPARTGGLRPRGRVVLLEGDSPAGLRLPPGCDQLGCRRRASFDVESPIDKSRGWAAEAPARSDAVLEDPANPPPPGAMVAEVRDGLLYLFPAAHRGAGNTSST